MCRGGQTGSNMMKMMNLFGPFLPHYFNSTYNLVTSHIIRRRTLIITRIITKMIITMIIMIDHDNYRKIQQIFRVLFPAKGPFF